MAAELKLVRTAAEEALVERFPALRSSLPGGASILKMREAAFDQLAKRGLPNRRVEAWKYTDLRALMRDAAPLAPIPSATEIATLGDSATTFSDIKTLAIMLLNGHLAGKVPDSARLPDGLEIIPLGDALASGHSLLKHIGAIEAARDNAAYALNAAFMSDGVVIRVAAGVTVERPIHLRFVNHGAAPFATATRVLLVVEAGASVTLLETHEGLDGLAYQPNSAIDIIAGDGATIRHVRVNAEGREALALSSLTARLGANVSFNTVNVVSGSMTSRHQVFLTFAGEHSKANINGATLLNGRQHADTTLVVDHAVPHCDSKELFKTVIDDTATGVFQGKIIVRPHAQKTDGRMMSGALLLSDGGTMNNKPELEIFADDVQCAHGATCGQLDEDLLFYLMARGLPRREAESLMVQAFLGEAIESIEHEGAREALLAVVERWLAARH